MSRTEALVKQSDETPLLPGIRLVTASKGTLCKICNVWRNLPDVLSEITLDLAFQRKTQSQIIAQHSEYLINLGLSPLSRSNLTAHSKHSDPRKLSEEDLEKLGLFTDHTRLLYSLYKQRFQKDLDNAVIFRETMRQKIEELFELHNQLDVLRKERDQLLMGILPEAMKSTYPDLTKLNHYAVAQDKNKEIRSLINQLSGIRLGVLKIMVGYKRASKAEQQSLVMILNNTVGNLDENLNTFLTETIDNFREMFPDDPAMGTRLGLVLSSNMDKYVAPFVLKVREITIMKNSDE